MYFFFFFFFQAEDGIRDKLVTGVQTCALPICRRCRRARRRSIGPCSSPPPTRTGGPRKGLHRSAQPAPAAERRRQPLPHADRAGALRAPLRGPPVRVGGGELQGPIEQEVRG